LALELTDTGGICCRDKTSQYQPEYILKRVEETSKLEEEIDDLEICSAASGAFRSVIVSELKQVGKKYAAPRKTGSYIR
jgi:DNA gyrase subunit A